MNKRLVIHIPTGLKPWEARKRRKEWAVVIQAMHAVAPHIRQNPRTIPALACDAGTPACPRHCKPGETRCKWHGGMSTGPKTAEGKQEANRKKEERKKQNDGNQ